MQITHTITRAQLAAVREAIRQQHPEPSEAVVEPVIQQIIRDALDRVRDQYQIDAIPTAAFMRRIPPDKYAAIIAAAEQSPQLSAYLARLDEVTRVRLGSAETISGVAALVAAGLLTQSEADAVLAFDLPPLLGAPE